MILGPGEPFCAPLDSGGPGTSEGMRTVKKKNALNRIGAPLRQASYETPSQVDLLT
jgi:hypothetical protein